MGSEWDASLDDVLAGAAAKTLCTRLVRLLPQSSQGIGSSAWSIRRRASVTDRHCWQAYSYMGIGLAPGSGACRIIDAGAVEGQRGEGRVG